LADFLFDIARLHLNAYNIMLGASSNHTDQVIKRLRRILTPDKRRQGDERPKSRKLAISGKAGEKNCRSHVFGIASPHGETAPVQLLMSKFGAKVGESFAANVDLMDAATGEPIRAVGSREERDVFLAVDLGDPGFVAGGRYDADAEVRVGARLVKHLSIHIEVSCGDEGREDLAASWQQGAGGDFARLCCMPLVGRCGESLTDATRP
jgi:hypothetical protein